MVAMVLEDLAITIPLIVGLIGVGIAVFERAYKTFLEKKIEDPNLKFNSAYFLNAIISTGIGVTIVTAIIPAVIAEIQGAPAAAITLGSIVLNFIVGYGTTYRVLDAFNNSTEKRLEVEAQRTEIEEITEE